MLPPMQYAARLPLCAWAVSSSQSRESDSGKDVARADMHPVALHPIFCGNRVLVVWQQEFGFAKRFRESRDYLSVLGPLGRSL
jgi:hypothetical protein